MSGSTDEFCVVEPLTLVEDGLVQQSGTSGGTEGIAFGEKEQAEAFLSAGSRLSLQRESSSRSIRPTPAREGVLSAALLIQARL